MGILMDCSDVNLVSVGHFGNIGTMEARREYYPETLHTFTINTRETDFGSIVEPIPITVKTYAGGHIRPAYPHQPLLASIAETRPLLYSSVATSVITPTVPTAPSPKKYEVKPDTTVTQPPPPKKKWIKEYLEEEPSVSTVPASRPLVGVVCASPPTLTPVSFTTEHSRPRIITNNHGPPPQIPSPPVGSNGSSGSNGSTGPRSGTREVHNKLEKNRRAHLKECFELLKRQLPTTTDDKKTSNLSILGSAIRYIQLLRRKERDCEHEMERLAREKIAAQQKLAALRREVSTHAVRSKSATLEDKDVEERINGQQVIGLPISMTTSASTVVESPPRSLNLSTKLRTLPIQLTPTTSQVVQTSYGSRHNTLTLTTLAPVETTPTTQMGVVERGRVVVGGLQLLAPPLLFTTPHPHHPLTGVNSIDNSRSPKQNGIVSTSPATDGVTSVVVSPIVVSNPQHLLHHTLTHKMVERQVVKGGVSVSPYLNSGLVTNGLMSNGLMSNGLMTNGLVSNGLMSNGLVSNGLVSNGIVSPVVVVSTSVTPPSTSV